MKKFFLWSVAIVIALLCAVFFRMERFYVVKMKMADTMYPCEPEYCPLIYIKDYGCRYFDFKRDLRLNYAECGHWDEMDFPSSGVTLVLKSVYQKGGELQAVKKYRTDHAGMIDRLYTVICQVLANRAPDATAEQLKCQIENELCRQYGDCFQTLTIEKLQI